MRRELMLTAAEAVFAEKGYAKATLEEIAQRAEFGKGTLYNYFEGGKEEILFAIFDRIHDDLCGIIDETLNPSLLAEQPFRVIFDGFLRAIFGYFLEGQDRFLVMIKEGHRWVFDEDAAEKAAYFLRQGERIIQGMVPGIAAAIAQGEIKDFPPQAIAHMVMGNIKGYQMHMCLEKCRCGSADGGGAAAGVVATASEGRSGRAAMHSPDESRGESTDEKRVAEHHTGHLSSSSSGVASTGDGAPMSAGVSANTPMETKEVWSMPTPEESARFIASFLLDGLLVQKKVD